METRASGILLHVTSLPSACGVGDLGPEAYRFADFLAAAGQTYWQVLPLNPTQGEYGNSPYSCPSVFAGNPVLISLELMRDRGYLNDDDFASAPDFPGPDADYGEATKIKSAILRKTFHSQRDEIMKDPEFLKFCAGNSYWLDDYSIYAALKQEHGVNGWRDFPGDLVERDRGALDKFARESESVHYHKFVQFIFFVQWAALKNYANDRGVQIIGDLPYYVNYDSSDVWADQELFKLGTDKEPLFAAGVPPDYFSETGQLWGNPVYDWDKMAEDSYSWWVRRVGHNMKLFDKLRLDHFRGFVAYWEIPAGETNAVKGKWVYPDSRRFLSALFQKFDKSRFIAEDLGLITEDVKETINRFDLPGMKILLFAFGEDYPHGDYLPANIDSNCIMYTGTHDNNTVAGWWDDEAGEDEKQRVRDYLGSEVNDDTISRQFLELAMRSRADTAIVPMQDVLGLGARARMNTPATTTGNWKWRLTDEQVNLDIAGQLRNLAVSSGRAE